MRATPVGARVVSGEPSPPFKRGNKIRITVQIERDSYEIITGADLISNRRHLQMGGSEFKAVLYGCVELADGYSAAPSYNDLQMAIETAFSGDNNC